MVAYLTSGFGLVVLLGVPAALAQGLSDPTRPPWVGEASGGSDAASVGYIVIVSKDRRQATINGQIVNLGGRYGEATLVSIGDEQIVLQRPKGTEVIRLFSGVQRTRQGSAARTETAAAKGGRRGSEAK